MKPFHAVVVDSTNPLSNVAARIEHRRQGAEPLVLLSFLPVQFAKYWAYQADIGNALAVETLWGGK